LGLKKKKRLQIKKKKPYSPQRWDLCWAVVEFEDDPTQSKRRPILITDSKHGYPIGFKATHVIRPDELEYELLDWVKEGLRQPTVVRIGKIIDTKGTPLTYIGTLTPRDILNIKTICTKYNISLIRESNKMKLINRNKLNEAISKIGNDGINNMDDGLITADTAVHGEAPHTYVDAIQDHIKRRAQVDEATKEIIDLADEVVDENQVEAHTKPKATPEMKKLKLAESLFEDYAPAIESDGLNRSFVELPSFKTSWKNLGLTDDDLRSLQNLILTKPELGIPLGSNVYKIRFKPVDANRGKSVSDRAIYIDIIKDSKIYLVLVFSKADETNITESELREIKNISKEL